MGDQHIAESEGASQQEAVTKLVEHLFNTGQFILPEVIQLCEASAINADGAQRGYALFLGSIPEPRVIQGQAFYFAPEALKALIAMLPGGEP